MPGRANMNRSACTVMIAAALIVALGMSMRPSLASHDQKLWRGSFGSSMD